MTVSKRPQSAGGLSFSVTGTHFAPRARPLPPPKKCFGLSPSRPSLLATARAAISDDDGFGCTVISFDHRAHREVTCRSVASTISTPPSPQAARRELRMRPDGTLQVVLKPSEKPRPKSARTALENIRQKTRGVIDHDSSVLDEAQAANLRLQQRAAQLQALVSGEFPKVASPTASPSSPKKTILKASKSKTPRKASPKAPQKAAPPTRRRLFLDLLPCNTVSLVGEHSGENKGMMAQTCHAIHDVLKPRPPPATPPKSPIAAAVTAHIPTPPPTPPRIETRPSVSSSVRPSTAMPSRQATKAKASSNRPITAPASRRTAGQMPDWLQREVEALDDFELIQSARKPDLGTPEIVIRAGGCMDAFC